jgi:hypothetical protein
MMRPYSILSEERTFARKTVPAAIEEFAARGSATEM